MTDEAVLPDIAVRLRQAHHLHSLSRTLRDLRPILELEEPTLVTLDLSDLTFIGPACLAFMVAVVRNGRENGTIADGSRIAWPTSVPAHTYLYRMDAVRVLFEHETNDPRTPLSGMRPAA